MLGLRMKIIIVSARLRFIIVQHQKFYLKTANINVKNNINTVLRTIKSHVKNCKYQFCQYSK
jgi:hypothetical protein